MPSLRWKMEYRQTVYERYHKAVTKEEKGQILKEFCTNCRYNRKYAIRVLNAPPSNPRAVRKRQGVFIYQRRTIEIAEAIWRASGYLCSQRLRAALPLWLPWAGKRLGIASQIKEELLKISARQLDNRLKDKKLQLKKKIYRTTKKGKLLKAMIPIQTSRWNIKLPGFLEVDTVAHCGGSLSGLFAYTLNTVDIATLWCERRAVLGKGKTGILNAVFDIKNTLPFQMRGIDSDNGEEFINYDLLDFCVKSRPQIQFTRSRPNKKDDNAHIEQRNDTHVRDFLGWDRYDTPEAIEAINDLYENELRLFQNLFQPSMKLLEKIRRGSKIIRKYDVPKTPFERVIDSGKYNRVKVKKLKELLKTLDPFELSRVIDEKLTAIYKMATQRIPIQNGFRCLKKKALECDRTNENESGHIPPFQKLNSPWRKFSFSKRYARQRKMMKRINRELALSA